MPPPPAWLWVIVWIAYEIVGLFIMMNFVAYLTIHRLTPPPKMADIIIRCLTPV